MVILVPCHIHIHLWNFHRPLFPLDSNLSEKNDVCDNDGINNYCSFAHDIHLLINWITTIFWRGKPDSLYQKPRPYKITIWRDQFYKPHIVGKILYYLQTLFLFNIWKINLNTWIKSLKLIGKPNKKPIKETWIFARLKNKYEATRNHCF